MQIGNHGYLFFYFQGGCDMTKEPTVNGDEPILPEIKSRTRKVMGEYALSNVSYRSLLDLYVRECKI